MARRSRNAGAATGAPEDDGKAAGKGHNEAPAGPISDELIESHMFTIRAKRDVLKLKREEQKAANGEYRAALKEAKKAGISPDAIIEALKLMDGDHETIKAQAAMTRRILEVERSPLAHLYVVQSDLFGDDGTGRPQARSAHVNGSGDKAWTEGKNEGASGASVNFCPYADGTEERKSWMAGWQAGQAEMVGRAIKPVEEPAPVDAAA